MTDRFSAHRQMLAARVGSGGIAIVPAAREQIRNDDVHHAFRQDSDFFYLTGFPEPDAIAVFAPGHSDGEFVLFVRPKDRDREIWDGYRAGTEGAVGRYGADVAYPLSEFDAVSRRMMVGRDVVWAPLSKQWAGRLARAVAGMKAARDRLGRRIPSRIADVGGLLADMRLIKDPSEIDSMRSAATLSAEGHREAMRFAAPGLHEYQVGAAMEYVWREAGSPRNGYPSIVASGPNACILHYVDNDRMIEDGDLVLIDAAAEIDQMSADITRTFPAGGTFTPPQLAVYTVVLAAHNAGLGEVRPGSSMAGIHRRASQVVAEGLVELGLLPGPLDRVLAMQHHRRFFMHGTGHWLGLDVHDAGAYKLDGEPRPLEPGMVLTVELGIYVHADSPTVELPLLEYDEEAWMEQRILEGEPARLRQNQALAEADKLTVEVPSDLLGIGVRIEDDVLVTIDGHEVLSARVPTHPAEVEELCAEPSWLTRD